MIFKKKNKKVAETNSSLERPEETSPVPALNDDMDNQEGHEAIKKKKWYESSAKKKKAANRPQKVQKENITKKPKKPKSEEYIIKKNGLMKVFRFVFWGILLFIFVNGIIVLTRPDRTDEVRKMIEDFEAKYQTEKDFNEEILGFAQNFAREYLTYTRSGESDFKERIKPYVSERIYGMSGIYDFKQSATAVYTKAYRKETYAPGQYDVYVMCTTAYTKIVENNEGTEEVESWDRSILKVPVSRSEQGYCIEDLPLFVEDTMKDTGYQAVEYYGTEIENPKVKQALKNFLTAWYEQEQSVINYFLTEDADKSKFYGLLGRYEFIDIDNVKIYQEEGSKDIICILKIKIKDIANESVILQEFNVTVIENGDRIYIKDLNTKIVNLFNISGGNSR